MTTLPGFSLYAQGRLDDDDFVATFVARQDLLETVLNSLRVQADDAPSPHQVLIGPHGMGKTTLLRRLAIAVARDESLADRFIPLRFREEQYNVLGLDVLWRNCAEALAEWCGANQGEAIAAPVTRATKIDAWRDPDVAVEDFLDACRRIGRRPVLLLDNLDLIVDALSEYQQWGLRGVLQRPDGPLVIGAAAERLTQGDDRTSAFHAFFHPHPLEPLPVDQVFACLRALADLRREAGASVRAILARQPARLRTLHTLTGGNPRLLTLLYQLLERAESDTVFADLEALVDQVTPTYKARVEHFQTAQQRAVIDAIALHWDPIPSGALAKATGIEVTTISSHLSRLKKSGFIQEVPTSGARSGYQLTERLLNIWYLMRHGTRRARDRVRWLTVFLTRLHQDDRVARIAANEDVGDLSAARPRGNGARADEVGSCMGSTQRVWDLLCRGRVAVAGPARAATGRLDPLAATLLDAGFALAKGHVGVALEHLGLALDADLARAEGSGRDVLPFLRLAEARGHGDKLIDWFETSGAADRYAPVHAALVAYVRGERFLLDVNPEVRAPAQALYERLSAPRRAAEAAAATQDTKAGNDVRKRGRRRAGR